MTRFTLFGKPLEEKEAYLLGVISSVGRITDSSISIEIEQDNHGLIASLSSISQEISVGSKSITTNSPEVSKEVYTFLGIDPEKRIGAFFDNLFQLDNKLQDAFVRGVVDFSSFTSATQGWVRAILKCENPKLKSTIMRWADQHGLSYTTDDDLLVWSDLQALELLGRLYTDSTVHLKDQYDRYKILVNKQHRILYESRVVPNTKIVRTRTNAVIPTKSHISDSGFDVTLLGIEKQLSENVALYYTGIKVDPPFGYYFDLVPRSSIIKTGYMLANNVGIIDQSYRGEILVALRKVDPNAPDLEFPARMAQLVLRPVIHFDFEEIGIDEFTKTTRNEGGFGSTGH